MLTVVVLSNVLITVCKDPSPGSQKCLMIHTSYLPNFKSEICKLLTYFLSNFVKRIDIVSKKEQNDSIVKIWSDCKKS